jgi:uncharacterized heparinase superfamily protein
VSHVPEAVDAGQRRHRSSVDDLGLGSFLPGMPRLAGRAGLYFHTARHLRPGQIASRLNLYAKRQTLHRWPWLLARRYCIAEGRVSAASQPLLPYSRDLLTRAIGEEPGSEAIQERFLDLRANRFSFLNSTVDFGERISWDAPGQSRLWRYNLHYFDFVWDLILADAQGGGDAAYRCFRGLVEDWLIGNPVARGAGWHAYPTALRIANWAHAALAFRAHLEEDPAFQRRLLASLYGQCRFLADHLEHDSRGNHLLKDGKALLASGLFFDGAEADRWFRRGARIVWEALEQQILADGGHYERSPMYHAIVLQDYLETMAVYRARGLPLPVGADSKVRAMVDFFVGLRHPDGEFPLFGDAAFGIARGPEELLPVAAVLLNEPRYRRREDRFGPYAAFLLGEAGAKAYADLSPSQDAVAPEPAALPRSGYHLFRDGAGNALVLDGGEIGPDEVPAHGHCNTFGYELSLSGRRVIVDSGVDTYEPGTWRDYYRSTRAHNVLTVDGLEQSEAWAAFRVARRARVRDACWDIRPDLAWFEGTHDGFARALPGLRHSRLVVHVPGAFWLIADRVWGREDEHRLESYLHLHPELKLGPPSELGPAGSVIPVQSRDGDVLLQIAPFGFDDHRLARGETDPIQGWYAAEFGRRLPSSVLVLSRDGPLPHRCGYALLPLSAAPSAVQATGEGAEEVYAVSAGQETYRITRALEGITLSVEKGI